MKKRMLVIVACFLVAIFCTNNIIADYLKVKSASSRISTVTSSEEMPEVDENKVAEALNVGIANAAPTSVKTYISDLKMASNSDSNTAKNLLRSYGYTVIDHNMNEGTGEGYVYLGYKTTTNKADAITDISMMDMKGGYRTVDYSLIGQEKEDNINDIIAEMINMLAEYKANYDKGSIGAILAFEGLNKVVYNKNGISTGLGTYLLNNVKNDKAGSDFLRDMLLKGNSSIVAGVYNYLTFAVQNVTFTKSSDGTILPTQAKTWLGEIENSDLSNDWEKYENKALALVPILEDFARSYMRAEQLYVENDNKLPEAGKTKDQIIKDFENSNMQNALKDDTTSVYLATYAMLKSYAYGEGTLADLFVQRDDTGNIIDISSSSLYPLVKALTDGQYASMHAGNLISLINNSVIIKGEVNGDNDAYKSAMDAIIATDLTVDNNAVDLFHGVNLEAYKGEVGITEEAYRQMSAENNYDAITKGTTEKDAIVQKINLWVGVGTSAIILVTSSFPLIGLLSGVFPTLFSKYAVTAAIAGFAKLAAASAVVSILNWISLGLIIIIVIYYLVEWLHSIYAYYHPKYTPIPEVMFNVKGTGYFPYNAVTDLSLGKAGDLNNFSGKEWNAMYTTKDTRAGDPLVLNSADSSSAVFKVIKGNSARPSQYEPVSRFGEKSAFNLNAHAYNDDVYGIFLFYLVDGTPNADKADRDSVYLARVLLRTEKTEDAAKFYLTNKGFKVLNVNLTLGIPERATYLGYQTTNIASQALTDIRIAYGTNQAQIMFGESSYGSCGYSGLDVGKNEKGDNPIAAEDYTLYATVDPDRGSPISSQLQVRTTFCPTSLGYEPVNLFSGGGAFNLRTTNVALDKYKNDLAPSYLYFSPSIKYTSGKQYLGGVYFLHNALQSNNSSYDAIERADFNDKYQGIELNSKFWYNSGSSYYLKFNMYYSTTYNPKRAIADMMIYEPNDPYSTALTVPDNMQNQGISYVPAEFVQRNVATFYGKYYTSANRILRGKALYLAPASSKHEPLNINDVHFSSSKPSSAYRSVSKVGDYYNTTPVSINGGEFRNDALYIYIKRPDPVMPKYISGLFPSYSMADSATDWARINSTSSGAERFVTYGGFSEEYANFNAEEQTNRIGLLGLSYTKTKTKAIRDIALYYVKGTEPTASDAADKKTHTVPPKTIMTNGIDYQRASTNAIYAGRGYYVYFYVTYSSLLGEPISSVTITNEMIAHSNYPGDKYETGKVLSKGIDSIQGFYFLKISRTGEQNYISNLKAVSSYISPSEKFTIYNKATYNWVGEAYVDEEDYYRFLLQQAGVGYYIEQNLNEDTMAYSVWGRDNSPVYLGFNRTSSKAAAITGIIARTPSTKDGAHSNLWWSTYNDIMSSDTYVLNNIVYQRMDLNVNVNGDYLFLYTTNDPRAGSPITSISVTSSPSDSYYNNAVKFTPDSDVSYYGGKANLNKGTKYVDGPFNQLFLHYKRIDGSVDKGSNSTLASVFTNSTTVIVISLAIVLSSGITCLIMYGRNKKKKNLMKK